MSLLVVIGIDRGAGLLLPSEERRSAALPTQDQTQKARLSEILSNTATVDLHLSSLPIGVGGTGRCIAVESAASREARSLESQTGE